MRTITLIIATIVILSPTRVDACGHIAWSEDAEEHDSDALQNLLTAEQLPLLSPSWHAEYWVIAWARLAGKTFSDSETDALDFVPWIEPGSDLEAAIAAWQTERRMANARPIEVEANRRLPDYRYQLVCGSDAFRTASTTFRSRRRTQTSEEATRWLNAQDLVFVLVRTSPLRRRHPPRTLREPSSELIGHTNERFGRSRRSAPMPSLATTLSPRRRANGRTWHVIGALAFNSRARSLRILRRRCG